MKKIFKYIIITSLVIGVSVGIGFGVKYALHHNKQNFEGTLVNVSKTNNNNPTSDASKLPNSSNEETKSIRIGFWNVLNYVNKNNSAKSLAIADVINYNKADLVGLAEIKPESDGSIIVDYLNKLDPKAEWSQLTTDPEGKINQKERYTFLYKKSLLETVDFTSPKTNPYLIAKTDFEFARPVAAVKFQTKGDIKNDFTVALDHFDAPGPKKKRKGKDREKSSRFFSGQGEQEVQEGEHLIDALNYIDANDGPNNEIIFMGDTNIKGPNHSGVFASTLKTYKSLLTPDDLSSLKNTEIGYANSYDKIFYKGDLKTKDAKVFDLWSVFDKKIVNEATFAELKKQDDKENQLKNIISKIRTGISDHAPVFFTLELNKNDKD
ncbi:endonuclease/exonuclease/phosphatase family protein [Mesomycoplasma bovoculi]|uniref:Membrane nuclease n=1 Tax=Mesomycoplasma bovoculi M165/69 TaxID=743966 RepID=W5USF8_9BACT|nr:endonuclease/exonuclease/phosphatase family protein [Mesomycoplasma bovoculi]AHH45154.1 membrane nuclease [Mesomycoplasma bovoculi M165/69]